MKIVCLAAVVPHIDVDPGRAVPQRCIFGIFKFSHFKEQAVRVHTSEARGAQQIGTPVNNGIVHLQGLPSGP